MEVQLLNPKFKSHWSWKWTWLRQSSPHIPGRAQKPQDVAPGMWLGGLGGAEGWVGL